MFVFRLLLAFVLRISFLFAALKRGVAFQGKLPCHLIVSNFSIVFFSIQISLFLLLDRRVVGFPLIVVLTDTLHHVGISVRIPIPLRCKKTLITLDVDSTLSVG